MTGQGRGSLDLQERYAALDERVTNLRSSLNALDSSTQRGFAEMGAQLQNVLREISSSQKTPWVIIFSGLGVLLTFLTIVGGLVYWPIQTQQMELKEQLMATRLDIQDMLTVIPQQFVSRDETEVLRARNKEDRDRMQTEINMIRDSKLGVDMWVAQNGSNDLRFAEIGRRLQVLEGKVDTRTGAPSAASF